MPVLISHLTAREILNSRGYPTVEASCYLTDGRQATASVPSGASTGSHEAHELRDDDPTHYHGKGVLTAVSNVVEKISPLISGGDPCNQSELDYRIIKADGTPNRSNFGANSILAVSLAIAKAGALAKHIELFQHIADLAGNDQILTIPLPMFNVINGGAHAGMNLDFQEFMIVPNANKILAYPDQLAAGAAVSHELKTILLNHDLPVTVGDEGGFAPTLETNRQAVKLISEASQNVNLDFTNDILLSIDLAANAYYDSGKYHIRDSAEPLDHPHYMEYLSNLIQDYKPKSFEDPFPEDLWDNWQEFTDKHSDDITIIGDDLLVTNKDRLIRAIDNHACNAILIKPNQIGTVTEAIDVVNHAQSHGFKTIASHRSGETTDTFIADFAVGVGTNMAKFGAPVRGERVAKYNRLLKIFSLIHQ